MKRCPECDSAETLEIALIGGGAGVSVAMPAAQKNKMFPKTSGVSATACTKCGRIFDLRLTEPEKLAPFAGYDGSN